MSQLLVAAALLSIGGCDSGSIFPDGPIEAAGRVVLAETGEPIAGLGVAILDIPLPWGHLRPGPDVDRRRRAVLAPLRRAPDVGGVKAPRTW